MVAAGGRCVRGTRLSNPDPPLGAAVRVVWLSHNTELTVPSKPKDQLTPWQHKAGATGGPTLGCPHPLPSSVLGLVLKDLSHLQHRHQSLARPRPATSLSLGPSASHCCLAGDPAAFHDMNQTQTLSNQGSSGCALPHPRPRPRLPDTQTS